MLYEKFSKGEMTDELYYFKHGTLTFQEIIQQFGRVSNEVFKMKNITSELTHFDFLALTTKEAKSEILKCKTKHEVSKLFEKHFNNLPLLKN